MYVEHNKPNWDKLQAISVLTSTEEEPIYNQCRIKTPLLNKTLYIERESLHCRVSNVVFTQLDVIMGRSDLRTTQLAIVFRRVLNSFFDKVFVQTDSVK